MKATDFPIEESGQDLILFVEKVVRLIQHRQ